MPKIPDLTDPRYLDELGWFLYHEKFRRDQFGASYTQERLAYSRMLLDEVLDACEQERAWLTEKTVVSVGCGCTGDLTAWPAAVKIAVDPLLYAYQKLGMLMGDAQGTSPTVYLSLEVEQLPMLDQCADLVVCRNALDHVPAPAMMLGQIHRILKPLGYLFLSVDIGGSPTPDEPTVFTSDTLTTLIGESFTIVKRLDALPPHSKGRSCSVRIAARKPDDSTSRLDKDALLNAYVAQFQPTASSRPR